MAKRPALLLALAAILSCSWLPARAQESETFDLFKSRLILGGEGMGTRSFRDDAAPRDANTPLVEADTDEFAWRSANLNLNVPLGGAHLKPGGRVLGHQFFGHVFGKGATADVSFLDDDLRLFGGGLGFTALIVSRGKNLYAASLFATVAEEGDILDDPDVRYTGLALGSYRKGRALWIYGGAVTYSLGRGLVLPVFGGMGKVGESWTLTGLVPFLFKATYKPSRRWSLATFLKINGNRYGYRNDEDQFPGEDEDLHVRLVEGRVGGEFSWSFADFFGASVESGAVVGRRLIFSDDDQEILTAKIRPGGFARFVLTFSFGDTLFDDEAPGS